MGLNPQEERAARIRETTDFVRANTSEERHLELWRLADWIQGRFGCRLATAKDYAATVCRNTTLEFDGASVWAIKLAPTNTGTEGGGVTT